MLPSQSNNFLSHVTSNRVTSPHATPQARQAGTSYDGAPEEPDRDHDTLNRSADTVQLSIVTAMYRSAPFLEPFCERVSAVAEQLVDSYEIILVNDGSPDDSVQVALQLQKRYPHVVVIDLSRNFGQHKAVMTGLRHASGELVFRIHCDLDEPPEVLYDFYQELHQGRLDSVFGVQEARQGGVAKSQLGACFYRIFNALSPVKIPQNQLSCRLMSRRFVDALLEYREQEIFMAGLFALVGFEQRAVPVVKKEHGHSTYTLLKRLSMMATAITSFSNRPLLIIPVVGLVVMFASVCGAIAGGIIAASGVMAISGWFWVIASVWTGTGLILLSLGILALYLINLQSEVKNRPYTTIRRIYRSEEELLCRP